MVDKQQQKLLDTFDKGMARARELFAQSNFHGAVSALNHLETRLGLLHKQAPPAASSHATTGAEKAVLKKQQRGEQDVLKPLLFQVYDRRCLSHRRLQEFDKARHDARGMVRACPGEPKGYLVLGKLAEMNDQADYAKKIYKSGLERCSDKKEGESANAYKSMEAAYNSIPEPGAAGESAGEEAQGVDPLRKLPYYDVFRPILTTLDFRTVLACVQVNKAWRNTILGDDKLYPEMLDMTIRKASVGWKHHEVHKLLEQATGKRRWTARNVVLNKVDQAHEAKCVTTIFSHYSNHIRHLTMALQRPVLFDYFLPQMESKKTFGHLLETLVLDAPFSTVLLSIILPMFKSLKRLEIVYRGNVTPNTFLHELARKPASSTEASNAGPHGLEVLRLFNIGAEMRWYLPKYIRNNLKQLRELTLAYQMSRAYVAAQLTEQFREMVEGLPELESLTLQGDDLAMCPDLRGSPRVRKLAFYSSDWLERPSEDYVARAQASFEGADGDAGGYQVQDLRILRGRIALGSGREFVASLRNLGCGERLTLLFLEHTRLQFLYDEAGYDAYIRRAFPNLETLSFGGMSEVGDATACAIVAAKPFPSSVIVSQTNTSYFGVQALIRAGVTRIGIQRCYLTMSQLQEVRSNSKIQLIESARFNSVNNDRVA